jgi:hypothetical protein
MCINYYNVIHSQFQLVIEKGNLQNVMLNNRRNTKLTFVRINQSRAGLNNIVNRLRLVTNMMNKNWLHLSRDVFKSLCKQHIIQSQLLLFNMTLVVVVSVILVFNQILKCAVVQSIIVCINFLINNCYQLFV